MPPEKGKKFDSGYKKSARIARHKRLIRLEHMLLRGVTNQAQLAAAFGVTQPCINKDIREIEANWIKNTEKDSARNRAKRTRQIEAIASTAYESYELSMIQKTKVKKEVPCENCDGEGEILSNKCGACKGKGKIKQEEIVEERVPGDVAHLKLAKECFVEIARLEGLYPKSISTSKLLKTSQEVGTDASKKVEALYVEATDDLIIRAITTLDDLQKAEKEQLKAQEPELIEVESTVVDDAPKELDQEYPEDPDDEFWDE